MLNGYIIDYIIYLFFSIISFSKKIIFFIFIIVCSNLSYIFSKYFVTLPFTYINPKSGESSPSTSSPLDYFESLIDYPVFTTIKINNKDLNFHITLDRYGTYISEKTYKKINSEEDNSNIENEEKLYSLDYIGINRAKLKSSNFSFFSNDTKNIIFKNYSFFITTKINNESDYKIRTEALIKESEEIGLNIMKGNKYKSVSVEYYDPYFDINFLNIKNNVKFQKNEKLFGESYVFTNDGYTVEEKTNLINQLKMNDFISSYIFSIKFDNEKDEKGKIVIGSYPHEIDKKHYNSKYMIYDKVELKNYYKWHYEFEKIIYDGEQLPWVKETEISLNFGFILSVYNYKDYLDKKFFKNVNYSEFCEEKVIGEYFVKICKEKVIKYFKPIYFYLFNNYIDSSQTNYLVFNYSDLFVKAPGDNDLYYFQIIFVDNSYKWIFGRPLFKKYRTLFDQEKKLIGFYSESGDYHYQDNNKNNGNEKKKSLVLVFVPILIIILVSLIVIGVLLYKNLNQHRKRKANELDDNYDYTPASDQIKGKNQNPLLIN